MSTDMMLIAAAAVVGVVAAITDITTRRIPNILTYAAALGAIAVQTVLHGWSGLLAAILGGLVGGGAFLIFYLMHTMGAGDVKLMMALGCLLGPGKALQTVLAAAIAGGVLAVFYALFRGRLRKTFENLKDLFRFHFLFGAQVHPTLNLSNPDSVRMPYGVAIAAGVVYTLYATIH